MLLSEKELQESNLILFNKQLDNEDINVLVQRFKEWLQNEYNKRLCKKSGKICSFAFCLQENHVAFMYDESKHKSFSLLENDIGVDIFMWQSTHAKNKKFVEQAIAVADAFVQEMGLKKVFTPTGGLAQNYVIQK